MERSSIKLEIPLDFKHAAVASPDGPEPTMIGPGINMHLGSSTYGSWTLLPNVSVTNSIEEDRDIEKRSKRRKKKKRSEDICK